MTTARKLGQFRKSLGLVSPGDFPRLKGKKSLVRDPYVDGSGKSAITK